MSKSKRIKDAAKELERALRKHVDVVTDSAVSMKKAQRAGARLASAAQLYAEAVTSKTGLDNPFVTGGGSLDAQATQSLLAERDGIAQSLTGSIPVVLSELPTEVDLSPAEAFEDEDFGSADASAVNEGWAPAPDATFETADFGTADPIVPEIPPAEVPAWTTWGAETAEAAPASEAPLDDAVEDWEDDSVEVDEDEPLPATADDEDDDESAPAEPPIEDGLIEEPASEGEPSAGRHAAPDDVEHIESVWSASSAAEPTLEVQEPAPALPAEEPKSEDDKPYSEDI